MSGVKPNKNFEFDVDDIDKLEKALRFMIKHDGQAEKDKLYLLLGKIHYQKTWYRPMKDIYVSG